MTSLTIGNSLNNIGYVAFSNCNSLKDVYCHAEMVPNVNNYGFSNCPIEKATLHVPTNLIESYKNEYPWKYFGIIVEL